MSQENEPRLGKDVLRLSGHISAIEMEDEPQSAELAKYRVQLTGAGRIKRGFDWDLSVPEAVLKRDASKFNKVGAYVNLQGNHVPSFMQSMQDRVGYFRRAKWNEETKTIDGDLVLARTDRAKDFKAQLDLDLASNNAMVQFSAVYSYDFSETEEKKNGEPYYVVEVEKIREVFSVDAVDQGAFPMKPLQQLAALSEWRGDSSKEESMAKEVETAQETEREVDTATDTGNDERIATLRADYAALQAKDAARDEKFAAQEAALAELQKRDEERDAKVAALEVANQRVANEAHFNAKVATLDAGDPGVAKLRESLDFAAVDTAGIDALVDPFIAAMTAAGRTGMDEEAIKVTQDVADSRKGLLTAAVYGQEVTEGDKKFDVMPVEKILGEQFGDVAAQHSPQLIWNKLNEAYLAYGLTDAEVDQDAMGQPVAKLGDASVDTAHDWGKTLIQTVVTVARMLHDGSEMTGWMNQIIPAMHRTSVPDFNNRYLRYSGTFGQLETIAEGAEVTDVNVSDAFRVPLNPIKKQGKFFLTYENVMNSPTAALRNLATAMGVSISSTDYHAVMDLITGSVGGAGYAAKTVGYENNTGPASATVKDTTQDFISNGNGNLTKANNTTTDFNYDNIVNAIDKMYAHTAYGEDQFALAGMIRAATIVCPPAQWGGAEALTRAPLRPGANQQNDVNRLQGMSVIPISTSSNSAANVVKFFAVLARPSDAQLAVYSTLNGQPPSFQPNVLRDDNALRNRITYKASNIRGIYAVDRRALVLSEKNA